jgi:hypothetical protein
LTIDGIFAGDVPILFGSIVAQVDLIGNEAEDKGEKRALRGARNLGVAEAGQVCAA